MNLYLVQHAEAKSKQEDPERGLTEKGQAEAGKMAAYLTKNTSLPLQQIVHSGKARARQTAEILAVSLRPAQGVEAAPDLAPLDDPTRWAERLATTDQDMMLVGHLPHLSKLAALLLCQNEANQVIGFQNSGVVCLARDEAGNWSVRWLVTPQIIA